MAQVGDARSLISTQSVIVIGDNGVTTDGRGTNFTNPPPEVGEDYYVFIRLYSAIDVSQTYSVIILLIILSYFNDHNFIMTLLIGFTICGQ